MSGPQLVVRGLRGGSTDVAVTARDPGGLTAVQRFAVDVEPPPPPVIGLGLPDDRLIFPRGGSIRFRIEPRPPSEFELEVRLDAGPGFVLEPTGGAAARVVVVVIPRGSAGVDVELREADPYFRLGELVQLVHTVVRPTFVGPAESGGVIDEKSWPLRATRSNEVPKSTVEFQHDGNHMSHAALRQWARVVLLLYRPIPLEAAELADGSRVQISFQPFPSVPLRLSSIDLQLPGGVPMDPQGYLADL